MSDQLRNREFPTPKSIVILTLTLLTLVAMLAFVRFVQKRASGDVKTAALTHKILPPKRERDGIQTLRSLHTFPAGDCVFEHHPAAWNDTSLFSAYRQNDFGQIQFEDDNPWYLGQDNDRCSTAFNCCTFAVSLFVDVTPGDWIGTAPTFDGHATPIAIIVDSYFDLVCQFKLRDTGYNADFEDDVRLQDDDLICFEVAPQDSDFSRRIFTHVGRVRTDRGVHRMLSKFGQGPIILSDLNFPNRMYPGADVVKIYRFRNKDLGSRQ